MLKMAKTKEKRELIKWLYARSVFFGFDESWFPAGLTLARQCENDEAQFFVSLFPCGAPASWVEAARAFHEGGDDARCLCWGAECGQEPNNDEPMRRSAEKGYALGQALIVFYCLVWEEFEEWAWLEKAAAQNEPEAMAALASRWWNGMERARDETRARQLWREAAELGHCWSQIEYAMYCCPQDSSEQIIWLRRASVQRNVKGYEAIYCLVKIVQRQVDLYDEGGSSRIVFEIGAAFTINASWQSASEDPLTIRAGERAVKMHQQWRGEAKKAVLCWLWLSRDLGVAKDMRILIADLIWDDRAAWSERKATK